MEISRHSDQDPAGLLVASRRKERFQGKEKEKTPEGRHQRRRHSAGRRPRLSLDGSPGHDPGRQEHDKSRRNGDV